MSQSFTDDRVPMQGHANSITRAVSKAQLTGPGFAPLVFQYNPTEISVSHNAEGASDPLGKSEADDRSVLASLATRGSTRLILSSLTFTGPDVQETVKALMTWVVKTSQGDDRKPERPQLTFEWGPVGSGLLHTVELMRFDCTYTRFTRSGTPIRAEVRNVTLHVLDTDAHSSGTGAQLASTPDADSASGRASAGPNTDLIREGLRK